MVKLGINGFGRIGRMVFRAAVENFANDIEVVVSTIFSIQSILLICSNLTQFTEHSKVRFL